MSNYNEMNIAAQRALNCAFDNLLEAVISHKPGDDHLETFSVAGNVKVIGEWTASENEMVFRVTPQREPKRR